jgi:hypothetical protein
MERQAQDPASPLLARAAFPESIDSTDGGRSFFIDYSHCRSDDSQLDTYVDTVHIPANPTWGDLYIRNKRSKDDIGHMLRAIATVGDCAASFSADAQADHAAMKASYSKWCQRIEADGWGIATLDNNASLYMPPITSTMSWFYGLGNAECDAMISIRLLGHGDPGAFSCGNGIHPLEQLAMTNDHNGGIVRAFHEAAVRNALAFNQAGVAQSLLAGLAQRVEDGLTAFEANKLPVWLGAGSLALLIIESANTGLPLTWREVRYIHKQIDIARDQYLNKTDPVLYKLFDPSTGDGEYPFEPDSNGAIELHALGILLGTCVSTYRNPASMPALDCARLKSWTP